MHVKTSSREHYFLFPYQQTKKIFFPVWKMTKFFPDFVGALHIRIQVTGLHKCEKQDLSANSFLVGNI